MPVVINRSTSGGSGGKDDKPKASSAKSPAKSAPAKPAASKAGKAAGGGSSAFAQMDEKKKIIGLSVIIGVSVLFVLWMTGMLPFGHSETAAPNTNSGPAYNPEDLAKQAKNQPVARPNALDRKTRIPAAGGGGMLPQGAPGGLGAQQRGTEMGDGNSGGNGIN